MDSVGLVVVLVVDGGEVVGGVVVEVVEVLDVVVDVVDVDVGVHVWIRREPLFAPRRPPHHHHHHIATRET